jgi:thioredoxin 1
MKKAIILILLIAVVVLGFFFLQNDEQDVMSTDTQAEMQDESQMETEMGSDMESSDPVSGIEMAPESELSAGIYTEYSPEKLVMHEGKDIVLFFKADWCPSCRGLDKDIKENMSQIPENIVILDVDYDQYTDLRQKYGVTTQHSLVQVSSNGDLIMKWSGGSKLETIIDKIN